MAFSCREEPVHQPLKPGIKPPPITETAVYNLHGAAVIHYRIPDTSNTLYVLAEYTLDNGSDEHVKSSRYKDSINVEGFSKTGIHDIQLYAVGADGQKSDPVTVQVSPLKAPVYLAFDSLTVSAAFGGVFVTSVNETRSDLAITIMKEDNKGGFEVVDRHFTNGKHIEYAVYNMQSVEMNIKAYLRDKWNNYSDTLSVTLTPLNEERITFPFTLTILPGDFGEAGSPNWGMDNLFDNSFDQPDFFTQVNSGIPQHFTVDLKGIYKLSRIVEWGRLDADRIYAATNPKRFRIWGSLAPNPNGEFDDSWHILGTFEVIKPSGLPLGQTSAEDVTAAQEGHSFSFSGGTAPVRYIRFETLETFGQSPYVTMNELHFYGIKE